jgi:hypothetical protein
MKKRKVIRVKARILAIANIQSIVSILSIQSTASTVERANIVELINIVSVVITNEVKRDRTIKTVGHLVQSLKPQLPRQES